MRRRPSSTLFEVPECTPELQGILEKVERFFLDIRGVGHFLSPHDSQLLLGWLGAGHRDEVLLRGIHRGATRVLRDRKGVRSLSSIQRDIERELKGTRHHSRREKPIPSINEVQWARWLEAETTTLDLLKSEAAEEDDPAWSHLVGETRAQFFRGVEGTPSPQMLVDLMSLSRTFYERVWGLMTEENKSLMRKAAESELEAWLWPMSEEAREETIAESIVGSLREKLTVLRPERMVEVWEG